MSFSKDPLYIMRYTHEVLTFGMLTDNDIRDFIMSQQEAKICGDPWCALSLFYCYMSIPDKMVHPLPDGGCTDEHEKGVQTPFNGSWTRCTDGWREKKILQTVGEMQIASALHI